MPEEFNPIEIKVIGADEGKAQGVRDLLPQMHERIAQKSRSELKPAKLSNIELTRLKEAEAVAKKILQAKLQRLGFDTSKFQPPTVEYIRRSEEEDKMRG